MTLNVSNLHRPSLPTCVDASGKPLPGPFGDDCRKMQDLLMEIASGQAATNEKFTSKVQAIMEKFRKERGD